MKYISKIEKALTKLVNRVILYSRKGDTFLNYHNTQEFREKSQKKKKRIKEKFLPHQI